MNPYLDFRSDTTNITINGLKANNFGFIELPLESLSDVNISTPTNNQLIAFDSNSSTWKNLTVDNVTPSIANCSDVVLTNLRNYQILQYLNGTWNNITSYIYNSLSALIDVYTSGISNNQSLIYDSNLSKWINYTLSSSFLSDFQISSPSANQILQYISGKWSNASINIISSLAGLTDCNIITPSVNQVLQYISGKWTNTTINIISSLAGLTDCNVSSPSNNQVLQYNSATSKWNNSTVSSGSTNLAGLSDCAITSTSPNQVLMFNGSKWTNQTNNIINISQYYFCKLDSTTYDVHLLPGYDNYLVDCNVGTSTSFTNTRYIYLPNPNNLTNGTVFYVQIMNNGVGNIGFNPFDPNDIESYYIEFSGTSTLWTETTYITTTTTFQFTFYESMPNYNTPGFIVSTMISGIQIDRKSVV